MRKLKLYIETSVWNFFFAEDAPEKMEITKNFFASLKEGASEIFVSDVVLREIANAPEPKRTALAKLIEECAPAMLDVAPEAEDLAELYLDRGAVPPSQRRTMPCM
jgi:predicted nucleic acid-binding protein